MKDYSYNFALALVVVVAMTGKSKLLKNENLLFNLTFSLSPSVQHETHKRHVRHTKKTYLTFKNEFENFEVYKIGFLIRVMLATNVYAKPEKKWFTTFGEVSRQKKGKKCYENILKMYIKNEHLMNCVWFLFNPLLKWNLYKISDRQEDVVQVSEWNTLWNVSLTTLNKKEDMTTEGFKMEIPNNVLSDGKSSISVSICRPTVCYMKCAIVVRPSL